MTRTRGSWIRRAALVAAAAALAAAAPASADTLDWGPCPDAGIERSQCATLTVPKDYANPGAGTIDVAVSRIPAASAERRRGVLLFNPGGPGESGLYEPEYYADVLPQSVLDRYDLIGFDPRGINRSAPVGCALAPEQLDVTKLIPWLSPDGFSGNLAYASGFAASCRDHATGPLAHISTANTARDMDRIRVALGEPRISYVGYSYGTYLGAVYGTLFPASTDRFVLDSIVNPNKIWREAFRTWGPGVEIRFPDFARWAAERDETYGLGDDAAEVRRTYFRLVAALDAEPVEIVPGYVLTGNGFRDLLWRGLRSDLLFPQLAEVWQLADAATPQPKKARAALAALASFDDPPDDNAYVTIEAVACGDADWPEDPEVYRRDVLRDSVLYPIAGAMAANIWPCFDWPHEPSEPPVKVRPSGAGRYLLVQGLRDPATPYEGGLAMRLALGSRSRLVSVNVGGHVVTYDRDVNPCADDAATSFLVSGELPSHDRLCPAAPPGRQRGARRAAAEGGGRPAALGAGR